MAFREIIVSDYKFKDELGEFIFHNVSILVDDESDITEDNFNQESSDYSISSDEIERMGNEATQRFFNLNYQKVLKKEKVLTPKELSGISLFLRVNQSELADLLTINKSNVSRIYSGENKITSELSVLIMEKLCNEIESPGQTKAILKKIRSDKKTEALKVVNLPAKIVAEWFIRKFIEFEDHITNLKLQKLLYYAQGVGAGRYNVRLIKEDFYAWEHGPVEEGVYHHYKTFQSHPLPLDPEQMDLDIIDSNPEILQILEDTMNAYGRLGPWVLRNKTHTETPWIETKKDAKIEFEKIYSFFKTSMV